MKSEIILWSEDRQKRLQEHLVGTWANDVWLVTSRSSRRAAVYLRFSINSIPLKLEIKYAVWSKFNSGQWKMERDQKSLRRELTLIIEWLNHFAQPIQSLMEKGLEEWEMSLRSYIVQMRQQHHRVQKNLLSTQEYVE